MIRFPDHFVELKYPGYYYHTVEKELYSIKVSGILTPLKLQKKNVQRINGQLVFENREHWKISVNGKSKKIFKDVLEKVEWELLEAAGHIIPTRKSR